MIHTPTCPHMNVRTHLTDKSVELLARHITYMYVRDTYQVTQTGSTINRKKTCLVNTRRWTALCSVSDSSKKAALPPPHCGFNTERRRKPPTPHCGKPLSPTVGVGGQHREEKEVATTSPLRGLFPPPHYCGVNRQERSIAPKIKERGSLQNNGAQNMKSYTRYPSRNRKRLPHSQTPPPHPAPSAPPRRSAVRAL